jgi:hypothetical protein
MKKNCWSGHFLRIGLMCMLLSNHANAELLRYDVDVRDANTVTPLGHMLFEVVLGQESNRNIWPFLQHWEFVWEGRQFSDLNSTPAGDALFRINEQSLQVVTDGIIVIQGSALQCALYGLCPYLDFSPHFTRGDAEVLYFSGFNDFGIPTISEAVLPDEIIYTASRVMEVPVPGTIWILATALLLLRFPNSTYTSRYDFYKSHVTPRSTNLLSGALERHHRQGWRAYRVTRWPQKCAIQHAKCGRRSKPAGINA